MNGATESPRIVALRHCWRVRRRSASIVATHELSGRNEVAVLVAYWRPSGVPERRVLLVERGEVAGEVGEEVVNRWTEPFRRQGFL